MKNVVLTGSSNGFGYLAANSFAQKGYKVWATPRSPDTRNLTPKRELEATSKNINVIELERR